MTMWQPQEQSNGWWSVVSARSVNSANNLETRSSNVWFQKTWLVFSPPRRKRLLIALMVLLLWQEMRENKPEGSNIMDGCLCCLSRKRNELSRAIGVLVARYWDS